MKERPILFSGAMVRALLDGSKTQTRRVIKDQSIGERFSHMTDAGLAHLEWLGEPSCGSGVWDVPEYSADVASPCGQPGDRLLVRETFFAWGRWETRFSAKKGRDEWHFVDMTAESYNGYLYAADGVRDTQAFIKRRSDPKPMYWKRPAIFMPRAASRITLEITEVRVERLQDISEADAQAEGCALECMTPTGDDSGSAIHGPGGFIALWESINGPTSWDANPWVWVVEFKPPTTA